MTKKISLSIYIDSTGNNKTNDAPKGMETNVARIYDLQETEVAFDFSKNGSNSGDKFDKGLEGNIDAFGNYLKDPQNIESGPDTISMKIYHDGVGSQKDDPDGDPLTLDHLRGLEHGKVSLVNGRLAFIPEEGYFGDIEFSYWVRDHAFAYPVMATERGPAIETIA